MTTALIWMALSLAHLAAVDAALTRQRYHREVLREGQPQPRRDPCGYRDSGIDERRISILLQLPDCIHAQR